MDFLPELTFGTEFSTSRKEVLSLYEEEALFQKIVLQGSLWHKSLETLAARPLGFKDRDGEQSDADEDEDASEHSDGQDDEEGEDGEESGQESNGMSDADSPNERSDSDMSQEDLVDPRTLNPIHSMYDGAGFGSG